MNNEIFEKLEGIVTDLGAYKTKVIDTDKIETDEIFREMCAKNYCGTYGKCYMCPPDIGDIHDLMKEIRNYRYALVYQTVSALEDSYDFEGMVEAKKRTFAMSHKLRAVFDNENIRKTLHLGSGGCGACEVCAKRTNEPCRHPELAMASLEAYGINVSKLAAASDMKYINGQDTVTYFGAVLFDL